jgi:DNA-binding GntR family transcriptional regulator
MAADGLPARIASELMTLISVGDLPSNTHLSTQKLADRFAVSRTPVREALDLLARRGVVEQRPNKGYFIPAHSPKTRRAERAAPQPTDAPPVYYRLAEDWFRDVVPAEVTEQFLRERYGLTKGQLSAVLHRAASEGWIERKAGYGWRFLPVAKTPEAIEQIYRLRLVLEPAGLLEPTFRLDRPVVERLKATFTAMLGGGIDTWPADRLQQAGVSFHEELMKMSGNPFFLQALVRANRVRRLGDYRAMIDRKRVYAETTEHLELLDLVLRGEVAEASYRMRHHVGQAIRRKWPVVRSGDGTRHDVG